MVTDLTQEQQEIYRNIMKDKLEKFNEDEFWSKCFFKNCQGEYFPNWPKLYQELYPDNYQPITIAGTIGKSVQQTRKQYWLRKYWKAKTAKQECKAYDKLRNLGLPESYGEKHMADKYMHTPNFVEMKPGEAREIDCGNLPIHKALPLTRQLMWTLSSEHMSELSIQTLQAFLAMASNAHTIDIHMRADGRDYKFQADVLKYMKGLPVYKNNATSKMQDPAHVNFTKTVATYEKHSKRNADALNYLRDLIDGDSPMDSEISNVIRILEGTK